MLYGPRGLDELMGSLRRIFGRLTYEVAIVELAADAVLPRDGYELRTFPVRHGRDALGYALVEDERPGTLRRRRPRTRSASRSARSGARCSAASR